VSDETGRRANTDLVRFKWIVVASLLALIMILGTIEEIVK
jgi:hypothetical protein